MWNSVKHWQWETCELVFVRQEFRRLSRIFDFITVSQWHSFLWLSKLPHWWRDLFLTRVKCFEWRLFVGQMKRCCSVQNVVFHVLRIEKQSCSFSYMNCSAAVLNVEPVPSDQMVLWTPAESWLTEQMMTGCLSQTITFIWRINKANVIIILVGSTGK